MQQGGDRAECRSGNQRKWYQKEALFLLTGFGPTNAKDCSGLGKLDVVAS